MLKCVHRCYRRIKKVSLYQLEIGTIDTREKDSYLSGRIYGLVQAMAKSSLRSKLRSSVISAVNRIMLLNYCTTLYLLLFLADVVTLIRRPFI